VSAPRVRVHKRRTFASVDIDLWPCEYDLTTAAQEECRSIMHSAGVRGSCGRTSMYAHRAPIDQADALAELLLAIVLDPANQKPIGP
jgi:hypothetical protein